ncbi:hypothetical protein EDD11_006588 [Mortierella claussenii]|nr:hypothetical protein EDD11_006588 [Mortierella claussenii]
MDYFMTEVRNIEKTKADVGRLWQCDPSETLILGIDLGQSYVVGANSRLLRLHKQRTPVGDALANFYKGTVKIRRHRWDAQRARAAIITELFCDY